MPQLAPSLLGFLALVLTRAGDREVRRQRVYQAIGGAGRSRDRPESPAEGSAQEGSRPAGWAQARAGRVADRAPTAPSSWLHPVGLTVESHPADPDAASRLPEGMAGPGPLPRRDLALARSPTDPVGPPGPTWPPSLAPARRGAPGTTGAASPEGSDPPARRPVEVGPPPRPVGEADRPGGPGGSAQSRLLAAHIRRTARREAMLTNRLTNLPGARRSGSQPSGVPDPGSQLSGVPDPGSQPSSLPALGSQMPGFPAPAPQRPHTWVPPSLAPQREAAAGLQLPPPAWRPGWLSPAPGCPPEPHPGPAAWPAGEADGSLPAPAPPPALAPDQLREQLARILKDDALRHGLDLKEG